MGNRPFLYYNINSSFLRLRLYNFYKRFVCATTDVFKMERKLLEKKILLDSILSKGRLILKRDKRLKATQGKLRSSIQSGIDTKLVSNLKPKTDHFKEAGEKKVKSNKQLSAKLKRKAPSFKVREPKQNYIDKDMIKQKALENMLRESTPE